MAHANCDECGADYDFTPQNARIHEYYNDMECCNIVAKCPNGHEERIFLDEDGFFHVLGMNLNLPRTYWRTATIAIKEGLARLTGDDEPPGEYDDLPAPPRDWLISLHDTLRQFGGES